MKNPKNLALVCDHPKEEGCNDYTLVGGSCWIVVGNIVLYIIKMDDGVSVDAFPNNREFEVADGDPIASLYALEDDIPEEDPK